MNIFKCPKCGLTLEETGRSFRCTNGHCYDVSASGYVNLLLSNTKNHGDDAEMVSCRRAFLDAGHYSPLCRALCESAAGYNPRVMIDAGCGEGYYTEEVKATLPECEVYGIDISKKAAEKAAKRVRSAHICVGSIYNMPYSDESFDALYNVFSPLAPGEYLRVLKPGGAFIMALPAPEHLYELKALVYEEVKVKELKDFTLEGFELTDKKDVAFKMDLNNSDLKNLFEMTPYAHKTSKENIAKLDSVPETEVTAAFVIAEYRKGVR